MTYNPDLETYIIRLPKDNSFGIDIACIFIKNEMVSDCPREVGFMYGWSVKRVMEYCKKNGWEFK